MPSRLPRESARRLPRSLDHYRHKNSDGDVLLRSGEKGLNSPQKVLLRSASQPAEGYPLGYHQSTGTGDSCAALGDSNIQEGLLYISSKCNLVSLKSG